MAVLVRGHGTIALISTAISNYEKAARGKIGKALDKVRGAPVLGFTDLSYHFILVSLFSML